MVNKNEKILLPVIKKFNDDIENQNFVIDKTGVKLVEKINFSIELDPTQPFLNFFGIRKSPKKYIRREMDWYLSQDLSVREISKYASIWDSVSDENGMVNSNYGYLVYSSENYNQFKSVAEELKRNMLSRRAVMIYNRPSMQVQYNSKGMSDFICTMFTQHFIRNNKLHTIVTMRSNDFIFGFFNDFAWQCYVHNNLLKELQNSYEGLESGTMYWNASSMHLYERHFDMIKKISEAAEL